VLRLVSGHFDERAGYSVYRPNGTTDWLLILTLNGLGRCGHSGGELITKPGDLTLLEPGAYHDYGVESTRQRWELLWTHFHPRPDWLHLLEWPTIAPGLMTLRGTLFESIRRIQTRFADVHRHASSARARGEAFAMNALEELLLLCDERNPRSDPTRLDERIARSMEFMAANLEQPINATMLADQVALSPSRFAHLFRAQTRTTPQQFLENRRLDRAATLLRVTQLQVKEIAVRVGFASAFYFTLRFKRWTGQSPTEYRHTID